MKERNKERNKLVHLLCNTPRFLHPPRLLWHCVASLSQMHAETCAIAAEALFFFFFLNACRNLTQSMQRHFIERLDTFHAGYNFLKCLP